MKKVTRLYQTHKIVILLLVLMFSVESAAEEPSNIDIVKDDVSYLTCNKADLNKRNTLFTDIDKIIKKMAVLDCQGKVEQRKELSELVVEKMHHSVGKFAGFQQFSAIWSDYVNKGRMVSLHANSGLGQLTTLKVLPDILPIENQDVAIIFDPLEKCKEVSVADGSTPFKSCQKISENLETSLGTLNVFRLDDRYSKIAEHVGLIEADWKNFMEESRFQTSLDVLVTTWMYSDKWKQADLQGPPPIQYFALHPALVYSYMPDASRGEEAKPVPAIEWFGMNWWKNKLPIGFSITSVYNDRPDGKKFPLGLTLHVDNRYSFGVVGNGDDRIIFFNLDIMDWFSDKQKKYDVYEKEFKEFKKGLNPLN
jgi:hypothetical protein